MKFLNREILDNLREKGINPNSIVQDGKTEQLFYVNYVTKVREYLEEKLANITEDLKTKFELLHPTKRGRKKREQVPQPQKESVATAHSGQY